MNKKIYGIVGMLLIAVTGFCFHSPAAKAPVAKEGSAKAMTHVGCIADSQCSIWPGASCVLSSDGSEGQCAY